MPQEACCSDHVFTQRQPMCGPGGEPALEAEASGRKRPLIVEPERELLVEHDDTTPTWARGLMQMVQQHQQQQAQSHARQTETLTKLLTTEIGKAHGHRTSASAVLDDPG